MLDRLHRWCGLTRAKEPPSTDLAKAAGYFVNHWPALTRFLADGRLSPDNKLCESQLRDIALGWMSRAVGLYKGKGRAPGPYDLSAAMTRGLAPV